MNPLELVLGLGTTIIERLFPDPTQAAQAKLELLKMQQNGELAAMTVQTDINKVEAESTSVFVSGWRPFIGWICGMACAWNWIGLPIAKTMLLVLGYNLGLQQADISQMLPVLMGMLGLGGLRTLEKINGVNAK